MATKYVYDKYGQFDSNHYDQLRETLDTEIKSLANKFADLVIEENFDRYQLEKYVKNEIETQIIFQINSQNHSKSKNKS